MNPQEFIDKISPYAVEDMKKNGIFASLSIAQAILESGWGKSLLATTCFNLFGIKWKANCGYQYKEFKTKEQDKNGNEYVITAKFCKYTSYKESFNHHSLFLKSADIYKDVVNAKDYKSACKAIGLSGYSTDKKYESKLLNIIKKYKLYKYDIKEINQMNNVKLQNTTTMKIIYNEISSSKYNIKCPYEMTPKYITIHNTANNASAKNEIAYMQRNNNQVSFHIAVDDKEAIIGIPLNRNAWHCGDGNGDGNRKSIGIEICYSTGDETKFRKAELNAIQLVKQLMKIYNIPIQNVVPHRTWAKKNCPHKTNMNWFIGELKNNTQTKTDTQYEDEVLAKAVSKIIKSGINLDFNKWKCERLIKRENVIYLLPRLAKTKTYEDAVNILVVKGIITDKNLWINKKYEFKHIKALFIKFASKL